MSKFGEANDPQRYQAQEVLGQGTYGKVYKAFDTVSNRMIAMKRALLDLQTEGVPTTVMREVVTLKDLTDHPNIVKLIDVVITEERIFLIFEYLDQDLRKLLESRKLEIPEIKRIFHQITEALNFCHSRRIMHRDLKPENILLDLELNTKLADFGLARAFQIPMRPYTQCVQTLWYRAPEILLGFEEYSVAVDMWSAGCILAELFTRRPLFQGENELGQLFTIFRVTGTPTDREWPGVSQLKNYSSFPSWLAQEISNLVPGADATALDLLSKLLALDPNQRLSAKQALSHPFFN